MQPSSHYCNTKHFTYSEHGHTKHDSHKLQDVQKHFENSYVADAWFEFERAMHIQNSLQYAQLVVLNVFRKTDRLQSQIVQNWDSRQHFDCRSDASLLLHPFCAVRCGQCYYCTKITSYRATDKRGMWITTNWYHTNLCSVVLRSTVAPPTSHLNADRRYQQLSRGSAPAGRESVYA